MINILLHLLFLFLGTCAGFCILLLVLYPKIQRTKKYNYEIEKSNQQLAYDNASLKKLKEENKRDLAFLKQQIKDAKDNFQSLKDQAKEAGEELFQSNYALAQERIKKNQEELDKEFEKYQQECKEEYLQICEDSKSEYLKSIQEYQTQIENLENQINSSNDLLAQTKTSVQAAIEAQKRQESMEEKRHFYQIVLSDQSKKEIEKIKEILPQLKDPEPLNKVIWKVYYEKPTNEMIGRVIGEGIKSGIYKITEPNSKRCYVGQSVNLTERFKQHIKRGLGAEPITKNKLYPAMQEIGVENFTFEVIEECPKEKLDEREDFWQEYFEAKTWGYSIK